MLLPLVGGCAHWQAQGRINPRVVAIYPNDCGAKRAEGDIRNGAIDLDCYRFPETVNATTKPKTYEGDTAYKTAATEGDTGLQARNRLTSILLSQSDSNCTFALGKLTADEAISNTVFSTLTTSVSAAATVVSGNLAKSILSGVASVSSGTQSNVNLHVYRNQIAPTIAHAINIERDKLRKEITDKFNKSQKEWPIDLAINDVNRYNQTCSLYHGFEILLASAENSKNLEAYKKAVENEQFLALANQQIPLLQANLSSATFSTLSQSQQDDLKAAYSKLLQRKISVLNGEK